MKCGTCGKEYQTYNKICPFCHSKNKNENQEKPIVKSIPYNTTRPSIPIIIDQPTERTRSSSLNTANPTDNTLKYVLTGGAVLLVVLLAAAMAQSVMSGSPAVSNRDTAIVPEITNTPIPSKAPIVSSTQPKITYSGSRAGTLSPYGGDSGPVNPKPVAPDYTASGYRYGSNPPATEATLSVSDSRSAVVHVTSIPTTIVTVSPPKAEKSPISQPKAVEPPSTPPKAVEPQKHQVGDLLYEMGGGGNPFYSFYVVMGAEYREQSSPYMGGGWIYTVLRGYEYPSGGGWYALVGAQPTEMVEESMIYDAGYSTYSLGVTTNINPLPREPAILKLPEPKYHQYDIVQVNGHYDGSALVHSGGNTGTYSIVRAYETSNEGDVGVYFTSEIRKKEDGSWGYVLSRTLTTSFWDEKREFEANVNQFVTHLTDDTGLEYVDEFPTIVPISLPKTPTPCGTGCSPVNNS